MAEDLTEPGGWKGPSIRTGGVALPPDILLTVHDPEADLRLDVFLSRYISDWSRSAIQTLIKGGEVQVNGLRVKPSHGIRTGDCISVRLPKPEEEKRLVPAPLPLNILYEDEDILVINKAPGMVVHPGAGHAENTLVHGLLSHCPRLASQGSPLRPGIVHRLDQDTSGALVVAKSNAAYLNLINQFKDHTVLKHYLALVYGSFSQAGGQIRTSLGRHPADRKKMAVLPGRGREAVTHWRVDKAWEEVTLLRVTIETGRTHQIRVHLSHLRHPVVGDATYGGGKRKARSLRSEDLMNLLLKVDRQMLHAEILAFRHPRSGEPITLKAPLPDDFFNVLQHIESNFPHKTR